MSMSRSSLKKSKRLFSSEMLPNHVISISLFDCCFMSDLEETISLNRNSFKLYLKLYVDIRLFRLPWLEFKKKRKKTSRNEGKANFKEEEFFYLFLQNIFLLNNNRHTYQK
jgi:hypothetical protein